SSGTAALWLTLRALGVKASDEILMPAHTAFPTVEAICLAEATPVFLDADEFYTLDVADATTKITPRTVGDHSRAPVRPAGGSFRHPGPRRAPRHVVPRGLCAGAGRRVGRTAGRQLLSRGGVFILSVEKPSGDGGWRRRSHQRRPHRAAVPPAPRARPAREGRPRRSRL